MYTESLSENGSQGSRSILRSPTLNTNTDTELCMSMAVLFTGTQSDMKIQVEAYQSANGNTGTNTKIFQVGPFTSDWKVAKVNVPIGTEYIDVVGVHGKRENTGIAVDDVRFAQGTCSGMY